MLLKAACHNAWLDEFFSYCVKLLSMSMRFVGKRNDLLSVPSGFLIRWIGFFKSRETWVRILYFGGLKCIVSDAAREVDAFLQFRALPGFTQREHMQGYKGLIPATSSIDTAIIRVFDNDISSIFRARSAL